MTAAVRANVNFTLDQRHVAFQLLVDGNNPADANTMLALDADGCCEPEVAHVMARVLRAGDHAVDIGANIGFFTMLMADLVGPTGSVIAIEPTLGPFMKLRENLKLNRYSHVSPLQVVLWEKMEEVTLYQCADSGSNSLRPVPASVGRDKRMATTLDRALTSPRARLIKMDVEGAEESILYGAPQLVPANVPFLVSELNEEALRRFGNSSQSYRGVMRARGYSTFLLHPSGALPTLVPAATKLIQGIDANINVLFSTIDEVSLAWPEVRFR